MLTGNDNKDFFSELSVLGRTLSILWRDPRLPLCVRALVWIALAYLICPFDFKPDFLADGLFDDSLIAPALIFLGLTCVPTGVLRDAKRMARDATCGIVCLTVLTALISVPGQSEFSQQTSSETQSCLDNSAGVNVEHDDSQPILYCVDEQPEDEDWVLESDDKKNKNRIAAAHTDLHPCFLRSLEPDSISTSCLSATFHRRSIAARTNHLQLYDSGDDSDSDQSYFFAAFFRPPFQTGGLFVLCESATGLISHEEGRTARAPTHVPTQLHFS